MPTLAGFPLTTISQNCLRFAFTPRIEVTKVPPTLAEYLPGHLPRGVPPLVTDPFSPCTVVGLSGVLVRLLTCTVTVGPEAAASAPPANSMAMTSAPASATRDLRCMRGHPFPRGLLA